MKLVLLTPVRRDSALALAFKRRRSQCTGGPSISARMATDSATLDRRAATPRRAPEIPKIQSPAEPIARGIGLDRPFFDDKNRAFWILQSIGWGGYLVLRLITGFANNRGWMWLVPTLLLTATRCSPALLVVCLFPPPLP